MDRECLLSCRMTVTNHGDADNQSVGVVLPQPCRDVLGVRHDTTLQLHCWRDRLMMAPLSASLPDTAPIKRRRRPVVQNSSLQVNIPAAARDVLGVEQGDMMHGQQFDHCLVARPLNEALAGEAR